MARLQPFPIVLYRVRLPATNGMDSRSSPLCTSRLTPISSCSLLIHSLSHTRSQIATRRSSPLHKENVSNNSPIQRCTFSLGGVGLRGRIVGEFLRAPPARPPTLTNLRGPISACAREGHTRCRSLCPANRHTCYHSPLHYRMPLPLAGQFLTSNGYSRKQYYSASQGRYNNAKLLQAVFSALDGSLTSSIPLL